ncbi:1,4-dihydroxy-6-naphthoate synthase [Cohnella cholangitidis]|uniref:1,4-dihydroxy-6-naphtoate synthase n=1 Tax=Cohnella cholangitidis TaxID=2598458 RepID=A0A7G5BW60_9BACL|nr:1,4-dihydroxy-6-naphthoate synthase [Cohnella cholangitidis]QMV41194.1 1,4-dihydroxy-6-naphthoate synthase [Cohnella cholangitidis]
MKIAYSPCPNDTFVFHALVHGLIPGTPSFDVTYADIDITNTLSASPNELDIMKISYAALPWIAPEYKLVPCGGALGRGCGPLVLTSGGSGGKSQDASLLSGKRVAVPSERSTAYLLFRLWAAQNVPGGVGEIVVMPFHEIMPAVRDGLIDAGLVIHEARFTYQNYGLSQVVDLGNWWESDTGLPIPLGAIIARRSLDLSAIREWIQASVEYAWQHPEASRAYVLEHAQEMDPSVAQSHIDLYVNDFTADLGDDGFAAITTLLQRAMDEELVPMMDLASLR